MAKPSVNLLSFYNINMANLPPLALYIHIPWCAKKCPYCDFNSHQSQSVIPEQEYIKALLRDLNSELPYVNNREISSIFIGGGTPSLFSANGIQTIIDNCAQQLRFSSDIEITMEANPGSSEQAKFTSLRQAGINRLSLGIQSFQQTHLEKLGRVHNHKEAFAAIEAAQLAGFKRINIDLMHGLPNQTLDNAMNDLHSAINAGVEHISWYQLTIEQNTEFFRKPPTLPNEDTLSDIQDNGLQLLQASGFNQYEISAFCKPQQQARHNLNYWQFGDYLAIGAGAHGKTTLANGDILRYQKTRSPKDYLNKDKQFMSTQETLSGMDILFESLLNGLRLTDGMCTQTLLKRSNSTPEQLYAICQPLINDGLLLLDEKITTTPLGYRFLNTVLERLIEHDIIK